MRTTEIKVGNSYLYNNNKVVVMKIIRGKIIPTISIWSDNKRKQRKFKLDNGEIVFAKHLQKI